MCASLVGTLERGLGYHLEHRKNGFFSKRDQRGSVPPDGHLRFIFLCAEMAKTGLYIKDIQVSGYELEKALVCNEPQKLNTKLLGFVICIRNILMKSGY